MVTEAQRRARRTYRAKHPGWWRKSPVEDTPVEDTPVEDTPVEDTPVEDTPVEDTPVEDTPDNNEENSEVKTKPEVPKDILAAEMEKFATIFEKHHNKLPDDEYNTKFKLEWSRRLELIQENYK